MENMMKSYNLSDLTDDDYYWTGLMTLIIYIQDNDYSSGHYTLYNTSRTITIQLLNWSNNSNHIYRTMTIPLGTIRYAIPVERLLFHYWTGLITLIIIIYTGHWLLLWHYTIPVEYFTRFIEGVAAPGVESLSFLKINYCW